MKEATAALTEDEEAMALAMISKPPARRPQAWAKARGPRRGRTGFAKPAPVTPLGPVPVIQPKLTVGAPDDRFEQEADRVADEVMRTAEPTHEGPIASGARARAGAIQRKCSACEEEVRREPLDEEEEQLPTKRVTGATPQIGPGLQAQISGLRGGGRPLPAAVRGFFEPRFGYDFGQVRVHTSGPSADLARSINARAFTLGRSIIFGQGQYAPGSREEKRLIAHELTHTMQQTEGSRARNGIWVSKTSAFHIARARPCGRSTAPSHTAGTIETQFKLQGYRFWRSRFIRATHWRRILDDWYFERGPPVQTFAGLTDRKNRDIVLNTGFSLLYNPWARGFRGTDSKSLVHGSSIQWR